MIVELLGQGIHPEEDETCGNHVCSAIKDSSFTQITIFVAFIRKTGLNYLKDFIKKARNENRNVIFYVGIDERVTSREALQMLLDLDTETYIYNSERYIYHPKIYLFEGDRNRIIVGSSNLTKSGLFYNVESSILLDFTKNDRSGIKVLNQIKEYYSPLFDFTDPNLELLTPEYLSELIDKDLVSTEKYSGKNDYNTNIHDKTKKRGKNPKITGLGNLEVKKYKRIKQYKSNLKITEDYLAKWDSMFTKLKLFYNENNPTTVPADCKDRTLYGWYRKQKQLYNANLLPEEHFNKLLSINFYFDDAHELYWDKIWLTNYNQLLEIYKETGDCNVKRQKDNTHPQYHISNWVGWERGRYKKGKLKDWQIKKLEDIGFKWNVMQHRLVDDWLEKLSLLQKYKKENGDCNISQTNKNPKYQGLGKWLNDQRNNHKKKRKVLPQERIDLLEEIGVVWNMDVYNFDIRIQKLVEFKKEFGSFDVPSSFKPNPTLGNFIYRLKTKGVKEKWKIEKLHQIGFFEIGTQSKKEQKGYISQNWLDNYEKLKNIPSPNIEKENKEFPELAKWLHNQKSSFRHGKLKKEQINKLKSLEIKLPKKSKKSKRWQDFIELIEMFRDEYGQEQITEDFDIELYEWLKQQEINYKAKKLRKEKISKLVELKVLTLE
jgi:HKD family nuclease